jgi:(2Fe-2S) ferredoxin
VIYPQGIWYGNVQLSDVSRVVEETICHGQIIEELLITDSMLNTKGRGPQTSSSSGKTP